MLSLLWLLLLCFSLPSCRDSRSTKDRTPMVRTKNGKRSRGALSQVVLQEAKITDIPIPLTATAIPRYFCACDNSYMLGYKDHHATPKDIANYYEREMERYGWRSVMAINGYEWVQQFEKPSRVCIISIRAPLQSHKSEWIISSALRDQDLI